MAALVTRKGKEYLANALLATPSPTSSQVAWGQNAASLTAAATDVALFFEYTADARSTTSMGAVTTTTPNDSYQVVGTVTAGGARAIREVGLFDSVTQPAQATVTTGASSVIGSSSNTALFTTATFTPGNNNFVLIRTEVLKVTAGSGSTALTVVRAQNGSAAIATIAASDNIAPGNPPGQTGITGGNLSVHADFTVINLLTGDSIQFTITVQFT